MPIVASVGGNTGNQTVALMIRGLALDQITPANVRHLFRKELTVSAAERGRVGQRRGPSRDRAVPEPARWAASWRAAILLNLLVAAVVGVAVPLLLHRAGAIPAQGSSVLLTFTTDGMGFFIFLALARAFLMA